MGSTGRGPAAATFGRAQGATSMDMSRCEYCVSLCVCQVWTIEPERESPQPALDLLHMPSERSFEDGQTSSVFALIVSTAVYWRAKSVRA